MCLSWASVNKNKLKDFEFGTSKQTWRRYAFKLSLCKDMKFKSCHYCKYTWILEFFRDSCTIELDDNAI